MTNSNEHLLGDTIAQRLHQLIDAVEAYNEIEDPEVQKQIRALLYRRTGRYGRWLKQRGEI